MQQHQLIGLAAVSCRAVDHRKHKQRLCGQARRGRGQGEGHGWAPLTHHQRLLLVATTAGSSHLPMQSAVKGVVGVAVPHH
eukprot:251952-Prymnesium_polylepis.1